MRLVALAFVLALALAASGCGAADEAADETPAAAPENASLNIEQVLDTSGPMFIEGYLWSLEIVDADGNSVFKDDLEAMEHAEELPAGTYTVKSAMKPCMGNCDQYPGRPGEPVRARGGRGRALDGGRDQPGRRPRLHDRTL